MMEGIFFLLSTGIGGNDSQLINTFSAICVLFIIVFAMLENFLPEATNSKSGDDKNNDGDNGNVDQNVDQQSIPDEQKEQNVNKPSDGKPSSDNIGDFKYLIAIYVVIMWCTYMMDGMNFFARMKDFQIGSLVIDVLIF